MIGGGPRWRNSSCAPRARPSTTIPDDRRYHAQPTACAACGPSLRLLDGAGLPLSHPDPIAYFAEAIRDGRIGALKGMGGYHLVCDARVGPVVAELRKRKHVTRSRSR